MWPYQQLRGQGTSMSGHIFLQTDLGAVGLGLVRAHPSLQPAEVPNRHAFVDQRLAGPPGCPRGIPGCVEAHRRMWGAAAGGRAAQWTPDPTLQREEQKVVFFSLRRMRPLESASEPQMPTHG